MNGKGEWIKFLGGLAVAGLVSYFTAQSTMRERLTVVETQVNAMSAAFPTMVSTQERVRAVETKVEGMQQDLRDIKQDVREILVRVR